MKRALVVVLLVVAGCGSADGPDVTANAPGRDSTVSAPAPDAGAAAAAAVTPPPPPDAESDQRTVTLERDDASVPPADTGAPQPADDAGAPPVYRSCAGRSTVDPTIKIAYCDPFQMQMHGAPVLCTDADGARLFGCLLQAPAAAASCVKACP